MVTAVLLAAALAGALRPAAAQTITPRCGAFAVAGCAKLRFDLSAGGAPLALFAFDVRLGGNYTFAGGPRPTFTGEDAFSAGTPFTGTAEVRGGQALFVDFLASPSFTFELDPGGSGYLEFTLAGSGALSVGYDARDPDGGILGGDDVAVPGTAPAVVPEPATLTLVAAGALALFGAARRRAVTR